MFKINITKINPNLFEHIVDIEVSGIKDLSVILNYLRSISQ